MAKQPTDPHVGETPTPDSTGHLSPALLPEEEKPAHTRPVLNSTGLAEFSDATESAQRRRAQISDKHGRIIHYMRISLTDACNLRCVYCMPELMRFRPKKELLQTHELERLINRFHDLGFDKFRFTGGEPTIRPDLVQLVQHAANLPGSPTVAITTNALRLSELAQPLADAGLHRVNVSLDTLNPHRFEKLTRRDRLPDVLAGLAAAEKAGLTIKLNAVVVRNFNEADIVELARLSLKHDWQMRFLEMMPFGNNEHFQLEERVEQPSIQAYIEEELGALSPVGDQLDGEARVFKLDGAPGSIGFISPVSEPFCASCNRVRLTADGKLRLCLLRDNEVDLMTPLRSGAEDAQLDDLIRAGVYHKPWGHDLAQNRFSTNRGMSEIGG